MKYLCMVYQDPETLKTLSEDELAKVVAEVGGWIDELEKGGHHVYSMGLQSARTAATVRERGGKISVTDGPFAETKEQFGGFTVIEARDLNEAIQIASKMPSARLGSVEVRPAMDLEAELTDPHDRKAAAAIRRAMGMEPEAGKVEG
jgi:hypothetical protein